MLSRLLIQEHIRVSNQIPFKNRCKLHQPGFLFQKHNEGAYKINVASNC